VHSPVFVALKLFIPARLIPISLCKCFRLRIKGLARLQKKTNHHGLICSALGRACITKSEVFLVSVLKGDNFRFRFTDEIKDSQRDLIHRNIVLKQFEALERIRQENVENTKMITQRL
jgi:hypothetical protein